MKRLMIAAAALALSAGHSLAAEPYLGKWAMTSADCKDEALFTFAPGKIVGATFACDAAAYAPDGAGWKVSAKKCSGEEGKAPDMNFRLAIEGGKLQVLWSDKTKSGHLLKCGR